MKARLLIAMVMVFALAFAGGAFATEEPNWDVFDGIVNLGGGNVTITADLTGYPNSYVKLAGATDPYAIGFIGGTYDTYCNTDRSVDFVNWISMAQWIRLQVDDMYLHVLIRKPGVYTVETPMRVRLASNGEVRVTFEEVWGAGPGVDAWDAKWLEFEGKASPQLATPLDPQAPIDKKYMIETFGPVVAGEPTGFVDVPGGTDESITFPNSLQLHNLEVPEVGFDLTFQELPVPCNTVGDYVLVGRMYVQSMNQMWYIDVTDGSIDRGLWGAQGTTDPPYSYPN